MKIEVIIEAQPLAFIRRQSPDARKQLRAAIHAIERGDSFPNRWRMNWKDSTNCAWKTAA